jgi:MFS transporter, DHA3 family, tetracycline resistance protein
MRAEPYRLYLRLEFCLSLLGALAYATIMVYWVTAARLDPLQLLLLGTSLEASYFVLQLPTGVLADVVSRRLCVVSGIFVLGAGLVLQGLSTWFVSLLCAQAVIGLGFALIGGAEEAWIASELGEAGITRVYLRATQVALIGTVIGSLLSGVVALEGLHVPLLAAGSLLCALAVLLALVMPESPFDRPARSQGAASVARQAATMLSDQTRSVRRSVVAVPGLVLLLGMTFFVGLWSESFDRLWGAFLIRDIGFPHLAGLRPVIWFSLLACAVALLGLGSTELAKRRAQRLGPDSLVGALLTVMVLIGVSVAVMTGAHAFVLAVLCYLLVQMLRPVISPLIDGWMIGRIPQSVRATAISAKEMFDSGGQIIGGPVIGGVGNLVSIRAALLAGAAALGPAIGFLAAASRRIRPKAADESAEDAELAAAAGDG